MPRQPDRSLAAHYQGLFDLYDPTHRAVQWSSKDAQTRRFAVLCDLIETNTSVIDMGCGLGNLLRFLRNERHFSGRYLGLDFVPDFIEHATQTFSKDEDANFRVFDARFEGFPNGYDVIVTSGAFNNLVTDSESHLDWIRNTLERAFSAARVAVGFNSLSSAVDRYERDLFYSDPGEMFNWCAQQLTRKLTLRHDYNASPKLGVPLDYTLYLYK